jgi:hypothetical protein
MKMPEPIGVVAESRKTISTAFNTTIYTRERFHQGAKVYDKQALIDLLEAAAVECEDADTVDGKGYYMHGGDAAATQKKLVAIVRSMKEKL